MSKTLTIAGIDPSLTGTGLVAIHPKLPRPCIRKLLKPSKREHGWDGSDDHRLDIMYTSLRDWLKAVNPTLVVIEGYAFASRFSRAHALGELGGIFRLVMYRMGIPYAVVPPKSLKRFVLGPRASNKKDAMIKGVDSRWGVRFEVSDLADAYGLARIGCALYDKSITATDAEALNGVDLSAASGLPLLNSGYCKSKAKR